MAQELSLAARAWHKSPSEMLHLTEPVVALALDVALALRVAVEGGLGGKRRSVHHLPKGQVYATDADFDDSDWKGPVETRWAN